MKPARALTVLLLPLLLTGCTVGFKSYSFHPAPAAKPQADLSTLSVAYRGDAESPCMREWTAGFERALRQQHRIVKIQPLAQKAEAPKDSFLFDVKCESTQPSEILQGIGILTFAVVPMAWKTRTSFEFAVVAPNGERAELNYSYAETTYSWLPLMLFGFKHFDSPFGDSGNQYQERRVAVLAELSTRLIDDATPFLLSHAKN
jgi:hypothetical protein